MSKNILITGGSRGLGLAMVSQLVSDGHRVLATVRGGKERAEALFRTAGLGAAWDEGRLMATHLELSDRRSIEELPKAVEAHLEGRLDVLINNAGFGSLGPIEGNSLRALEEQMRVNAVAPMLVTRALLPALRVAKGRVITLSSVFGRLVMPYYSMYAASKHALEAYFEGLASEVKPFGVQVCLVEPGSLRTDFPSLAVRPPDTLAQTPLVSQKRFAAFARMILNGQKMGLPPSALAKRVSRLVRKGRVPLRSPLGPDAHILLNVHRLLPGFLARALIGLVFKLAFFRSHPSDAAAIAAFQAEAPAQVPEAVL